MKRTFTFLATLLLTGISSAQTHGSLNPNFTGVNGTDNYVQALPNGKIVLGAGTYTGSSVPVVLNADGSVDATFNLPFIEDLYPVVIHNSNGIYMFGTAASRVSETGAYNFDTDNFTTNYGLAGNQFNGRVTNAVELPDGSFIAAGNFDYVHHFNGPIYENYIVKYNADLSLNPTFMTNVTSGFNAEVTSIALDTVNDKLYCGGKFTQYNGNAVNGICRINFDGTFDNTFNSGTGFDVPSQFPTFMKVLSDGRLFVSSSNIDTYNGTSCNKSLMINGGNLVSTFGIIHQIHDVEEVSTDVILVVGETLSKDIQYANTTTGDFLNYSTTYPQFTYPDDFGTLNYVSTTKIKTITKSNTGSFFLSGSFTEFSTETVNNIVEVQLCVSAPSSFYTINGNDLIAIQGDSYAWNAYDGNENVIGSSSNQTFTHVPGAEYYGLEVIDGICEFSVFFPAGNLSAIEQYNNLFSIYPNPATTSFTLTNLPSEATIQLIDQTGRIVSTENATSQTQSISTNTLHAGIYFVHVTSKNGETSTQKLVIE